MKFFWHNIGNHNKNRDKWRECMDANDHAGADEWWKYLVAHGQVSVSYQNRERDLGWKILTDYKAGDTIIAYASQRGAIGWGIVENPQYEYVETARDKFSETGFHLHRLNGIKWKSCSSTLKDAISAKYINREFGIKHPRLTKSMIPRDKAEPLIAEIKRRFGSV